MRWTIRLFVISLLVSSSFADSEEGVNTDEDNIEAEYNKTYLEHQSKLQQEIFKNYNRNTRPVKDAETTVNVDIHLHVTHISFNQREQTMTAHGHMYLSWIDENLWWDPKDYDGVSTTQVKKWQVWQPDIRVSNSINGVYAVHDISRNSHITLQTLYTKTYGMSQSSKVETYPTFSMKVGCMMDYSDYPYDSHSCAVRLYTPKKMRQVKLGLYRYMQPTMFLSWSNTTQKMNSGDFTIHEATNNISYFRFGAKENDMLSGADDVTKTWTIYNMYVYFRRHNSNYIVTVAIPLATTTAVSLSSFLIRDVQLATLVNAFTFVLHGLYIRDFVQIIPPSVYAVPVAITFHGLSLSLTIFVFLFHLTILALGNQEKFQTLLIDRYYRVYNLFPVNPYPGFMNDFVKGLGDIRTRGWEKNTFVWRIELATLLSTIYLILYFRAFVI